MSDNTTRISDLPENVKMSYNSDEPVQNPTYKPMNIHPNPYGNGTTPDMIQAPPSNQSLSDEQKRMLTTSEQHMLPSRDIPMDQSSYQNDEYVQTNHIPKPKLTQDYIREYQELENNNLMQHEYKKQREENINDFFTDMQLPFFIGMLYFIFQMPLMDSFLRKYFAFIPIYMSDGNMNFYGMVLKSILFASCFYSINNIISYLVSI